LHEVAVDDPAIVQLPAGVDRAYDVWAVREAIDELPPDEREVVRLQHVEELTQSEVAERLGVPVGTVKSRSFRAHRRLAARLGHLREVPE
jgi:RNA polymerase sigma-70 factor (ECF subfamily)